MDVRLACWLDLEADALARTRYALEALLHPLGVRPDWVQGRVSGGPMLYYGHAEVSGSGVLALCPGSGSDAFFRARQSLRDEHVNWIDWNGHRWPVFFEARMSVDGASPTSTSDLVASTFFWLSGWDEWTRTACDRHGRAPYAGSAVERLGVIDRPCVDAYREMLAEWLAAVHLPIRRRGWNGKRWALCPTHDLDYSRKWSRGLLAREVVSYLLLNRRHADWQARLGRFLSVSRNLVFESDPYRRSFDRILEVEEEERAGATFFLKTAARSPYDAPVRSKSRAYVAQVRRLQEVGMEVGLHPGYFAGDDPRAFTDQRIRLERVVGGPVRSVRNHYLRWHPVATPRLLQASGIRIDASLGFAEHEGFRRGTCHPFRLYDLLENRALDVWEMPLLVMDSTLFGYRALGMEQALESTRRVLSQVQRFQGVAVVLWHSILYDPFDYPGWHRHFERTLGDAGEEGAAVLSLHDAMGQWLGAATE